MAVGNYALADHAGDEMAKIYDQITKREAEAEKRLVKEPRELMKMTAQQRKKYYAQVKETQGEKVVKELVTAVKKHRHKDRGMEM